MDTSRPEDTFKILIASDTHLGFMENDPIRGEDSVETFKEILSIAKEKEVDFILHAGDLFHDNKPSRSTLHACLAHLRQYCMGNKPIQFNYLSDQSKDFKHCRYPSVNYDNPNMSISIPVFSIHGNHDDPMGGGNLCSLDLLHTAGFVNYFGKATSFENIQISPLQLQKGETKLALYGLGSVRDGRLQKMFLNKNVSMMRPEEDQDQWFNMFVLHQNRASYSATDYIPERLLADFLDLVIWGHQHECQLKVRPKGVIRQPGSSIATSLHEGEKVQKHVGLLQICGKEFEIQPIPLETVRQFYMEDVVLSKYVDQQAHDSQKLAEAFCAEKVEALIEEAERKHPHCPKQPRQPLIRLRVDYSDCRRFEPFSNHRFGQEFVGRVANPKNILLFQRPKSDSSMKLDPNSLARMKAGAVDTGGVEDILAKLFVDEKYQLELLSEEGLNGKVKEYVNMEEKGTISKLVIEQLEKAQTDLKNSNTEVDQIPDAVKRLKGEVKNKEGEVKEEVTEEDDPMDDSDSDDVQAGPSSHMPSSSGRSANRASKRSPPSSEDEEDSQEEQQIIKKKK